MDSHSLPVDSPRIRVMLAISDTSLRDRCAEALSGEGIECLSGAGQGGCDVMLVAGDATQLATQAPEQPTAAVILIDEAASLEPDVAERGSPFDCILPPDFTARELQLACRLAARLSTAKRSLAEADAAQRRLQVEAETDPLTGLANRRAWEAACERLVTQAVEKKQPLVLAIVDLDRFKSINAQEGYRAGDRILQQVSGNLARAIRSGDFAARFGGDEFGLLLPGLPADRAKSVVERIRLAVNLTERDPPLTASAGFAAVAIGVDQRTMVSVAELFTTADRALRAAKAAGGNRVCGERLPD